MVQICKEMRIKIAIEYAYMLQQRYMRIAYQTKKGQPFPLWNQEKQEQSYNLKNIQILQY